MTSSFAVFKEIIKETRNSSSLYSYLQMLYTHHMIIVICCGGSGRKVSQL